MITKQINQWVRGKILEHWGTKYNSDMYVVTFTVRRES